jgi:SpoIVB peptidase S55
VFSRLSALFLAASAIPLVTAAPAIFPLKDIRPGQHGVGRTVFSGSRIEEFQVEILGVLENIGPKESIILARLKGGPLEDTGVMQGMSGSPVYIDGKLAGAVALGFPLAKAPICGIRPIEEMLRVDPQPATQIASRKIDAGNARLEELATPVSFSGFTAAALDHFSAQLKNLGLDPRQGVSGGGDPVNKFGDPSLIQPGSMISVQLLSGDMSAGADGTVTAVDGNRIYAFGHRFLAAGATEFPFARSEVLALLPNLNASFKISAAREWMGSITEDRNTAVSGVLGRVAPTVPLDVSVGTNVYHMRVIQNRVMTPLIAQMAIFSALDETERSVGAATYSVRGHIDFDDGSVPIDDAYSGDVAVAAIASNGVATPLAYAMASGFDALKLKSVSVNITPVDRKNQVQISDISLPRQVKAGEDVEMIVGFTGENGTESSKTVHYRVPIGAPAGDVYVTASEATYTNLMDLQTAMSAPPHSAVQVLDFLNHQHANTSAWLRIWRAEGAYTVDGRDLPDPPPSLALIFVKAQAAGANAFNWRGSKITEIEIPMGASVVTGSKTTQIEVKE